MTGRFNIRWIGSGQKPQCPPDPKYPNGIDIDASHGSTDPCCETAIPYPAPCIGGYEVTCKLCGYRAYLTAAGRPDDPKRLRVLPASRWRERSGMEARDGRNDGWGGPRMGAGRPRQMICKRGHSLEDPANIYTNPTTGARVCKACMKLRQEGAG